MKKLTGMLVLLAFALHTIPVFAGESETVQVGVSSVVCDIDTTATVVVSVVDPTYILNSVALALDMPDVGVTVVSVETEQPVSGVFYTEPWDTDAEVKYAAFASYQETINTGVLAKVNVTCDKPGVYTIPFSVDPPISAGSIYGQSMPIVTTSTLQVEVNTAPTAITVEEFTATNAAWFANLLRLFGFGK